MNFAHTYRKRLRRGFRRFLKYHLKQSLLLALVLFILGTIASIFLFPNDYSSETTLAPANRLNDSSHFDNPVDLLAESHNLASLFALLYNNREVLDLVQQKMNWEHVSHEEILKKITVTRTVKTLIVNISATDTDPQTAQKLSQAYADAMSEQLAEPLSLNNVELLRSASAPQKNRYWPLALPTVLVLSLVLSLLFEWLRFLFSIKLTVTKDTERYPFPLFGVVPTYTLNGMKVSDKEDVR